MGAFQNECEIAFLQSPAGSESFLWQISASQRTTLTSWFLRNVILLAACRKDNFSRHRALGREELFFCPLNMPVHGLLAFLTAVERKTHQLVEWLKEMCLLCGSAPSPLWICSCFSVDLLLTSCRNLLLLLSVTPLSPLAVWLNTICLAADLSSVLASDLIFSVLQIQSARRHFSAFKILPQFPFSLFSSWNHSQTHLCPPQC